MRKTALVAATSAAFAGIAMSVCLGFRNHELEAKARVGQEAEDRLARWERARTLASSVDLELDIRNPPPPIMIARDAAEGLAFDVLGRWSEQSAQLGFIDLVVLVRPSPKQMPFLYDELMKCRSKEFELLFRGMRANDPRGPLEEAIRHLRRQRNTNIVANLSDPAEVRAFYEWVNGEPAIPTVILDPK